MDETKNKNILSFYDGEDSWESITDQLKGKKFFAISLDEKIGVPVLYRNFVSDQEILWVFHKVIFDMFIED